jgi:hypothetical protein
MPSCRTAFGFYAHASSACTSRFSLCFSIFSGGLVKIELTRAAPASLYVSPSRFADRVAGPGFVAIASPNTLLSVKAISDGKTIVVDCPSRADMGLAASEKHGAGRSAYHGGAGEAYRSVNRCAVRSAWRVPSAMIYPLSRNANPTEECRGHSAANDRCRRGDISWRGRA